MPATVLGLVIGSVFVRLVRVNLIQTLKGDYVEAARARGVSEAFGRVPPRVQERARAGHHGGGPAVRPAVRRRRPHGGDLQLAAGSDRSWSGI